MFSKHTGPTSDPDAASPSQCVDLFTLTASCVCACVCACPCTHTLTHTLYSVTGSLTRTGLSLALLRSLTIGTLLLSQTQTRIHTLVHTACAETGSSCAAAVSCQTSHQNPTFYTFTFFSSAVFPHRPDDGAPGGSWLLACP